MKGRWAMVGVALVVATGPAHADGDTAVLAIELADGVDAAIGAVANASIRSGVESLPGIAIVDQTAGESVGEADLRCVGVPECLATAGAKLGARRVLGCEMTAVKKKRFELHCQLVDVGDAAVVDDSQRSFGEAGLQFEAGEFVANLLILAPELPALATPAEEEPDGASLAVTAAVEEPAPPRDDAEGARRSAGSVAVETGLVIPRGDLQTGFRVGGVGGVALDAARRLHVVIGIDWMQLARTDRALVAPPAFPRSQADLTQRTSVLGLRAGARYDLIELGPMWLHGGGALGLAINSSELEAFGMTRPDRAVGPLAEVEIGARGRAGPLGWMATLGWRETSHDLGDMGDGGEDSTSGLLVSIGMVLEF